MSRQSMRLLSCLVSLCENENECWGRTAKALNDKRVGSFFPTSFLDTECRNNKLCKTVQIETIPNWEMPSKNRMLRFHCVALVSNNQCFTSSQNKGNEWEAGIAPSFCLPGDVHCCGKLPVSDSTNCRHKRILKNYTWALLSINSFICSVFVHLKSYIYTSNKCKCHQGRISLPIDWLKITSSSRACNKTYNRLISKWKKHYDEIY